MKFNHKCMKAKKIVKRTSPSPKAKRTWWNLSLELRSDCRYDSNFFCDRDKDHGKTRASPDQENGRARAEPSVITREARAPRGGVAAGVVPPRRCRGRCDERRLLLSSSFTQLERNPHGAFLEASPRCTTKLTENVSPSFCLLLSF